MEGKTALVTGAAGGIGAAVVRALSAAGVLVTATDLGGERLGALAQELAGGYSGCSTLPLDISDPDAIVHAVADTAARDSRLDILVNAAGISTRESALETTVEQWDRVQAINLRGTFLACQSAAKVMTAAGAGSIVNVASELALVGDSNHAAYISSKAGVVGLTRALAVEWAPLGLRVNAVAPGLTTTPMTADLPEAVQEDYRMHTPSRRLGTPDAIADAIVFLASDASRHVVGHLLLVDGGYTIT